MTIAMKKKTNVATTNMTVSDHLKLMEEIRQARLDVEAREQAWSIAEPIYEEAAWYAFRSASERLNALLREMKEGLGA